ncbi:MAG: twin-arginine translocation signal domain-containing protein [Blastocatellia bacterium]|nr:twin-arginine translocation signal domain-containing protein [Blastocatellia bacterium]
MSETNLTRRNVLKVLSTLPLAGAFLTSYFSEPVKADQRNMHQALNALERAQRELRQATDDKGGHRAKALRLVDDAIAEVRQGMSFDRRH